MAKVKEAPKQKPKTKTEQLAEKNEKLRLKKVAKDAAYLRQMAYHEAAHYVVAGTLKRGEVQAHLEANYTGDKLEVFGERKMAEATAPSLPMLLSAVGWAGVLSIPFTEHNLKTIEEWYAIQNNHPNKGLAALASDDSEQLAGALKSAAVKKQAEPEDLELATAFADHAKSVMYAVWVLVKSRAKLRNIANQLILTGATYPKYKAKEWETRIGAEVIEAALTIQPKSTGT